MLKNLFRKLELVDAPFYILLILSVVSIISRVVLLIVGAMH